MSSKESQESLLGFTFCDQYFVFQKQKLILCKFLRLKINIVNNYIDNI